jgi:hypothetical protein
VRSAVIAISIVLASVSGYSQEWSDKAQYDAYTKGDWKQVVELGKLAKKAGADYYYIRARNGYANFMLGKYFKAEKEFEKALKFNSSDAFAKRYGYWSSVYAGNNAIALLKTSSMTSREEDTIKVIKPRFFNSISFIGGYRLSSSETSSTRFVADLPGGRVSEFEPPSSMPYVSLFMSHQLGRRLTLNHGINYLEQMRPGLLVPGQTDSDKVWQVGYLASLNIQITKQTSVTPSFIMQYWESGANKVYDLSMTLSVNQQFGNIHATLLGGYFQDTDTNKYMVGGSLTWYPLSNQKLYSITSGGYNIGGDVPNPFVRQTIGGNIFKRGWLRISFTWNNRVIDFEDAGLGFVNNSSDRLNWLWSLTPSYYPIDNLGISFTYSIESRQFYFPAAIDFVGTNGGGAVSEQYNFHSFYVGLNYNF